jgi:hypothetical protein
MSTQARIDRSCEFTSAAHNGLRLYRKEYS